MRLNAQGDTLWTKAYGIPGKAYLGTGGILVPTGEYIIIGSAFTTLAESIVGGTATVTKVDDNGNVVWHREIPGLANFSMYSPKCFCTKDGGFVVTGNKYQNNQYTPSLVKIDGSGNVLWTQEYTNTIDAGVDIFNKAIHLSDNGYAFVGLTSLSSQQGSRMVIGRTDVSGNLVWVKRLNLTPELTTAKFFTAGADIIEQQDGSFVVLGFTLDSANNRLVILHANASGDLLSSRTIKPNNWSITLRGITGSTIPDIGNAVLSASTLQHALYKTPTGYLIQTSLTGIGSVDGVNLRPIHFQGFINMSPNFQPIWMRHQDYNKRLLTKTMIIDGLGQYVFAGGAVDYDLSGYNNCLAEAIENGQDGSACQSYLNGNSQLVIIRTDGDLKNNCLIPYDLPYTFNASAGLTLQSHTLTAQAGSLQSISGTTSTQTANVTMGYNCFPIPDDQDFGGPIRVRELPAMKNPNRLIGSNEEGVLGSVVGENNGDILVWKDGLWKTQPAPTGGSSGTGGDIWQDNGDNVTLPPTKNVGVGVAQPQAKLQVNGNLIAGVENTISATNTTLLGSRISVSGNDGLVLATGVAPGNQIDINVNRGIAMITGETGSIFSIQPAPCGNATPGPAGEGYYGNCPTPTPGNPNNPRPSPRVGIGVVEPRCKLDINANGSKGFICVNRGLDATNPSERLAIGYLDNNYADDTNTPATNHIPTINYTGIKPALVVNALSNKTTIYPGKIAIGNFYRNRLDLMGIDNMAYSAPDAQLHIKINTTDFTNPEDITDAEITPFMASVYNGTQLEMVGGLDYAGRWYSRGAFIYGPTTIPTDSPYLLGIVKSKPVKTKPTGLVESDLLMTVKNDGVVYMKGNVGIGVVNPQSKLAVDGLICAKEVRVARPGVAPCWPDYVFAPDYDLRSFEELRCYIQQNKHLPEIPSAAQVDSEGILMGEMMTAQMKKIEELTLYILKLEERIKILEEK